MLVLSDDIKVPKRVALFSSWLWIDVSMTHSRSRRLAAYLHFPCYVTSSPFTVNVYWPSGVLKTHRGSKWSTFFNKGLFIKDHKHSIGSRWYNLTGYLVGWMVFFSVHFHNGPIGSISACEQRSWAVWNESSRVLTYISQSDIMVELSKSTHKIQRGKLINCSHGEWWAKQKRSDLLLQSRCPRVIQILLSHGGMLVSIKFVHKHGSSPICPSHTRIDLCVIIFELRVLGGYIKQKVIRNERTVSILIMTCR